jgi:hypothetical protein
MASTQTLRMDSSVNPIKAESLNDIPRIDLAKIDNVPYYIESNMVLFLIGSIFYYNFFFSNRGIY